MKCLSNIIMNEVAVKFSFKEYSSLEKLRRKLQIVNRILVLFLSPIELVFYSN